MLGILLASLADGCPGALERLGIVIRLHQQGDTIAQLVECRGDLVVFLGRPGVRQPLSQHTALLRVLDDQVLFLLDLLLLRLQPPIGVRQVFLQLTHVAEHRVQRGFIGQHVLAANRPQTTFSQ